MVDVLIASVPTPGQFIRELHLWIATYADGTEGIVGGNLGMGMTPLMSSRRATAERLAALAERARAASLGTPHPVVSVRLVTFTSTEGTRQ
jgi:hypothetical protein